MNSSSVIRVPRLAVAAYVALLLTLVSAIVMSRLHYPPFTWGIEFLILAAVAFYFAGRKSEKVDGKDVIPTRKSKVLTDIVVSVCILVAAIAIKSMI